MKLKVLFIAAALVLTPGLALAMGCSWSTPQSASACGEGQVWDASTQACVTPISS